MSRKILTEKDYRTLKKLLAGTDDDSKLCINIINECDIENSFLYILCLMSNKRKLSFVTNTELILSANLKEYLFKILNFDEEIPTILDLDFYVKLWMRHCEFNNIPSSFTPKLLLKEYNYLPQVNPF